MSFPLPRLERKREDDYEIGELLGRGNFTSVYHAVEKATDRRCAIKIIDRYRCERLKKTADVTMEKHCLRRLNHPNIVKLYGFFTDCICVYMVMEECNGGELWDHVKTVGLPKEMVKFIMGQVVNALDYMRQACVVHRDLKAENTMLNDRGVVKLIDFGTAKDMENPHIKGAGNPSRHKTFDNYVGTPQFMPAEVIENKCTDQRSDTWSLGCMIYQVLVGAPPFHAASEYLVFLRIMDLDLQWPPAIDPVGKDLVTKMVVKDPDARLGAQDINELRRHPFFENVQFEGLHHSPAPVMSLADLCLRKIGRRIKALKGKIADKKEALESLQPEVKDIVKRMQTVQKWLDDSMPQEADEEAGDEDAIS
mmetsp:Transcript_24222/g.42975  ORF Transcript_24222/g.42975 Transcript_24222/m.42975 type:complete len:365 (+) Transcript_24222:111-1205(+)